MVNGMKLTTKDLLKNGIMGVAWIIFGFAEVFKFNNRVILVMEIVLLVATLLSFLPYMAKTEIEDEMSKRNEKKAMSFMYAIFNLLISILMLITIIKGTWKVDLKIFIPFLLGGMCFFKYVFFVYYEKVGE